MGLLYLLCGGQSGEALSGGQDTYDKRERNLLPCLIIPMMCPMKGMNGFNGGGSWGSRGAEKKWPASAVRATTARTVAMDFPALVCRTPARSWATLKDTLPALAVSTLGDISVACYHG
jgi:hypothetical protein